VSQLWFPFTYEMISSGNSNNICGLAGTGFANVYNGWFRHGDIRVMEYDVCMDFSDSHCMTGRGVNRFGTFILSGRIQQQSEQQRPRLVMYKQYTSSRNSISKGKDLKLLRDNLRYCRHLRQSFDDRYHDVEDVIMQRTGAEWTPSELKQLIEHMKPESIGSDGLKSFYFQCWFDTLPPQHATRVVNHNLTERAKLLEEIKTGLNKVQEGIQLMESNMRAITKNTLQAKAGGVASETDRLKRSLVIMDVLHDIKEADNIDLLPKVVGITVDRFGGMDIMKFLGYVEPTDDSNVECLRLDLIPDGMLTQLEKEIGIPAQQLHLPPKKRRRSTTTSKRDNTAHI
jgi:hypothetical protein